MKQIVSHSEKETKKLAQDLAKKFNRGVIALTGELGAGKTTFVQGFAKALGIKEKIISPTFVLIRQHKIPPTQKMLYHADLYRLQKEEQFKDLGIEEIFANNQNLVLVEWAEKVEKLLPKNAIYIDFKIESRDVRKIKITIPS